MIQFIPILSNFIENVLFLDYYSKKTNYQALLYNVMKASLV